MILWKSATKSFVVYAYILTIFLLSSLSRQIYLYNTEDNDGVEYYDCVVWDSIPYCRRPPSPITLHRNNQTSVCHYNGKIQTFEELRRQNRTPYEILHNFQSSIEKTEEYALYLSGYADYSALCECPIRNFGKNCEYEIIGEIWNVTFSESRKWQNEQKEKNRLLMQVHRKMLCYTTLACDYGLLCLDWRDICDGRQQCMSGIDEEACDLLEFNECEDDEYRCSNGMCIPDDYFLDGNYDCMDFSDEQRSFSDSTCAYQVDSLNCDEHLCGVDEWSCGDGQCIPEKNRYEWQESINTLNTQCHSMREYMYMCELSDHYQLWTSVYGTCYSANVTVVDEKLSNTDCLYLIKCALSGGIDSNCPCREQQCNYNITQACPPTISYPPKGLLTPYLVAHYSSGREWSRNKQPDYYSISGNIRCRGYQATTHPNGPIRISKTMDQKHIELENMFCNSSQIIRNYDGLRYHPSCYANISHTLGRGLVYAFFDVCEKCIIQYRMNDGIRDCLGGEDERSQQMNTCTNRVRDHRFHCSSHFETCLPVKVLGDSVAHCTNDDDEFAYGSWESLSTISCDQWEDDGCSFLREYILKSGYRSSNDTATVTNAKLPFRSYCNTFWDLKDQSDESPAICQSWTCARTEFQCRSGQCILRRYICDGEWDCDDASDELFGTNHLSLHNQMINLTEKQKTCAIKMSNRVQPFDIFCNVTLEYPCLLKNFSEISDISHIRPCICIDQIGDGKMDCLDGLDERNTRTHCRGLYQLGLSFQCRSTPNVCIDEQDLCTNADRCPNQTDDILYCSDRLENCSHSKDFVCMNGTCMKGARCNGKIDCQYGEDEYWCSSHGLGTDVKQYRFVKRQGRMKVNKSLALSRFPSKQTEEKNITEDGKHRISKRSAPVAEPSSITALMCNRGVAAIRFPNTTVCFCPPSYYGDYCEYHSDRLTSYVHLNISHTMYAHSAVDIQISLKVLVLLMCEGQVIHSQQFHYRPAYDAYHRVKKRHYLIYSKQTKLLEQKVHRILNRTSIVDHSPYYLQYEAYELKPNNSIRVLSVWRYTIFFDFLPSFRFAKVLRYLDLHSQMVDSSCQSNPCNSSNAECHILQNDPKKYVCLCKSGYSGAHCSIPDPYCAQNFCHPHALCKPNYLGSTAGNRLPLCLCPLDIYGIRCGLSYDQCWSSPCQNNGSCYPSTHNMTKANCICHEDYYGDLCQFEKEKIDLTVRKNNVSGVSVIQYFYIDFATLDLTLAHQETLEQPPDHLRYRYSTTYAPEIVLLKNYRDIDTKYPTVSLLLLTMNEKNINSSTALTDENLCFNVDQLHTNISVYQYHSLCRTHSSSLPPPRCFFDDGYLCMCEFDNHRAECFRYDHQLDRCDQCFSHGRCVRGDLRKNNEFLCICAPCHYGRQCQFNSEDFSFTFEQLFTHSLSYTAKSTRQWAFVSIIFAGCFILIIGTINNLFMFITFFRSKFLQSGVGNYLFVGSVINQMTLSVFAFQSIYSVLNVTGYTVIVHATVNKILCKSLPFVLMSFGQLSYWLMSTIAIERLYVAWNIRGRWLKTPRIARRIMFTLAAVTFLINVPQTVFFKLFIDTTTEKKTATCVVIYPSGFWTSVNQVINYVSSLVPLLINIICTSGIMFLVIRQKLLANKKSAPSMTIQTSFPNESICLSSLNIDNAVPEGDQYVQTRGRWDFLRTVLHENIELIFAPAITILPQIFSLPRIILGSVMDCYGLQNMTIRYLLTISVYASYIPQMISFLLYVRFSSIYYEHFRATTIGKKIVFLLNCCRRKTKQQSKYSQPVQYALSKTIKSANEATM